MPSHIRVYSRTYVFITMAGLLWFGGHSLRAADRYVATPGGYGTNDTVGGYTNWLGAATNIQWAVNKAANGETIWVTNGTYYLTNEISVGNVILRSVNGMGVTTINGNYPFYTNRCFNIYSGSAVVTGFTIMNGYGSPYSGGVAGGGVYLNGGTLRNCNIYSNTGYWGGGIHIYGGLNKIYDCNISNNTVSVYGGGIAIVATADVIISNCAFNGNYSQYRGGGLFIYVGAQSQNISLPLLNCTFINNSASNYAGAFGCGGASNIIRNCIFIGNNSSNANAGGIWQMGYNATIQNCTFVKNSNNGLEMDPGSSGGRVENCILSSNAYVSSATVTNINNRTDSTITVGALNINNITNAPSFVNYAAGNYRLAATSPCINTGSNETWMTNAVDLDGRMRIRYGRVDMGAYERINEGAIFGFR